MLTDPDIQLMLNFQAGDQGAFARLFDKYKRQVINYCFRYCGQQAVAEELAQETFLRVYKSAQRYRPKARFNTWLFKIAANVCLNEIRKPVYRIRVESLDISADNGQTANKEVAVESDRNIPDALVEARQEQDLVRQAMARLPEDQRAALLLRASEGFSYKEIGQQINRSENVVKTLIHRGRQRMKKILGAHWGKNDH